jgi:hypothetical protein
MYLKLYEIIMCRCWNLSSATRNPLSTRCMLFITLLHMHAYEVTVLWLGHAEQRVHGMIIAVAGHATCNVLRL